MSVESGLSHLGLRLFTNVPMRQQVTRRVTNARRRTSNCALLARLYSGSNITKNENGEACDHYVGQEKTYILLVGKFEETGHN